MHRWLVRYEDEGLEGLGDHSHRPAHCPHQMPAAIEVMVLGYVRFLRDCVGAGPTPVWLARLMAAAYAAGAALTLDEFALWLNMRDVYWQLQGWESITAVLIFAGFLSVGIWGRHLARASEPATLRLDAHSVRLSSSFPRE